jgi:hypothetical protein
VAKIGGKTISQTAFMKEMQKNREMILQANKGEEALKYLESEQFKSDILNRMVNAVIIEKLSDNLGVQASKNLILQYDLDMTLNLCLYFTSLIMHFSTIYTI